MNAIRCPVCDSDQITAQETDGDPYELWEKCSCDNCNSTWTNFYKLYSQEIDDINEEDDKNE
jgi:hypothetical protein